MGTTLFGFDGRVRCSLSDDAIDHSPCCDQNKLDFKTDKAPCRCLSEEAFSNINSKSFVSYFIHALNYKFNNMSFCSILIESEEVLYVQTRDPHC